MKHLHTLPILLILLLTIHSGCEKNPPTRPTQPTTSPANQPSAPQPFKELSIPRTNVAAAATSSKLLIAGGRERSNNSLDIISNVVDVYDTTTLAWTRANLSKARYDICAIAHQELVFFAGGVENSNLKASSRVDIYNAATNTWSTAELSEARIDVKAAAAGNKVIFSGGYYYDANEILVFSRRVDIYDIVSNSWTTATLSQPRIHHTASAVGSKIYIAGGERPDPNPDVEVFDLNSGREYFTVNQGIDVYDVATNSWSMSLLQYTRTGHSAVAVDDKLYFIGGWSEENPNDVSKQIEILNTSTQTTSFQSAPIPLAPVLPAIYLQKKIIVITPGPMQNLTLILNVETGNWKEQVTGSQQEMSAYAVLNNTLYATDGISVWKQTF